METLDRLDPAKKIRRAVLLAVLVGGASNCAQQEQPISTPTPERQPVERCFPPSYLGLKDHLVPLIDPKQDGDLIVIGPNAVLMGRVIAVLERPNQNGLLIGVNTGKRGVAWVEVPRAQNDQFGLNPPKINVWDQRNVTGYSQVGWGAEVLRQVLSQYSGRDVNILIPLMYPEQQLRGLTTAQREATQQTLAVNHTACAQLIDPNRLTFEICSFVPAEISIISYRVIPPTLSY